MKTQKDKSIVFLCSGGGGNLRFIYQGIEQGWISNAEIKLVITDRECDANKFCELHDIKDECIEISSHSQTVLLGMLEDCNPDLIITNVNKILDTTIVESFKGKLINLHYSLLPSFGGLINARPVESALEYGAKIIGTTVHYVSEQVDAGMPILQSAIPVCEADTKESLMDIVFRCGCLSLASVVESRLSGHNAYGCVSLSVKGRECLFSGEVLNIPNIDRESIWLEL